MDNGYLNGNQPRKFVEMHYLKDKFSLIHFNALVTITTTEQRITNKKMEVTISFDNYNSFGQVTLKENDIDPQLFPTVFEAKWQSMQH